MWSAVHRATCCLILAVAPVIAQQPPSQNSPEGAARLLLEALRAGDYLAAARATDPAELRRNRQLFDSLLAGDQGDYLAVRLFQVDSVAQVRRLGDAEFTARLFAFQWRSAGGQRFLEAATGLDVVGVVQRHPDSAHVVYRWVLRADTTASRSFSVETMVRCGKEWCAAMLGDLRGLAAMLKQPIVAPPARKP